MVKNWLSVGFTSICGWRQIWQKSGFQEILPEMRPFPLHFLGLWVSTFGLIFTFHFHVTQKQLMRFLINYVVFKYVPANIFNFYEIFLTGAFLFASWYSWRWWINRHLKCVKENLKTRLNEVTRQFIQTIIAVSCWDKCWTNFGVYWLIYACLCGVEKGERYYYKWSTHDPICN